METKFNPNAARVGDCIARVQNALKQHSFEVSQKIITSQDKEAIKLTKTLAVSNIPKGFKKWQLPFVMDQVFLFISVGNPDIVVPEHSHDEGEGIRFIVSGSVLYDGKELKAGDWMYIPKGAKYSITIGSMGAVMCYCYCCCCA